MLVRLSPLFLLCAGVAAVVGGTREYLDKKASMINAIRARIIYADPAGDDAMYRGEKLREGQRRLDEEISSRGLIPSTSGPPANIFGQHLETQQEEEEGGEKKKKKEKGVWYVPWWEEEDSLSSAAIDESAVSSLPTVLEDLTKPEYKWDIETPKGRKSREHFSIYMQRLSIAMWRDKKELEDDRPMTGVMSKSFSGAEKTSVTKGREAKGGRGSLSRGAGGRGGGGGAVSIGGPANSANVFGRGARGKR